MNADCVFFIVCFSREMYNHLFLIRIKPIDLKNKDSETLVAGVSAPL